MAKKGKKEPLVTVSRVTLDDAALIADRCFGERGRKTVELWRQYNHDYFGGSLKPTPVLYVPTSPWGAWVGCHLRDRNIYLMNPGAKRPWAFVRGVLLHEMIHQALEQSGRNPHHDGVPFCEEIMRLSKIFGRDIWAGKYTVGKRDGRSVRMNKAAPAGSTAEPLNQKQISQWPHSIGIEPPDL